ncbi:MAG: ribose-5-phosphate isomerase RpiA [Sphingomonas fennica]
MTDTAAFKRAAAEAAVAEVADGMVVGLGTGSTAAFAIAAIGRRVRQGLRVTGVPTSLATAAAAQAAGIPLIDPPGEIDLAIDGVDEIDPQCRAIKGGGGAMLREKVVAAAARRMIAIADTSKQVSRLGAHAVPIEVLPFAAIPVAAAIARLGGDGRWRMRDGKPVTSDQGNPLLDAQFGPIADPAALAAALSAIPGLLGHGLFPTEIDLLVAAGPEGIVRIGRTG